MVSDWCLCKEKYFQASSILASVLFLFTVRPLWSSGKMLAANSGRGFDFTEGKFVFHILLNFRVECKELFCKTNIKL